MKYETIPYVDKPVSRILFGTAQPSFLRGEESNAMSGWEPSHSNNEL